MAERLFLHIGPHKTGTTAFQKVLDQNDTQLLDAGFKVVRDIEAVCGADLTFGQSTNCYGLAHQIIRSDLITPMRMARRDMKPSPDEAIASLKGFNVWARSQPAPNLILSSEAFSFLRTPAERALIDVMVEGLDIVPVAVKRDPVSWLRSWSGQLQKMKLTPPIGDLGDTVFDLAETSWLVDFDAVTAFWRPDGTVIGYEAALERHESIIPALAELMGLPSGLIGVDRWENVGAGVGQ
ncbi:MAG: hypothetical protein EON87_11225 [Brevundimonas sp.]|nr:MAG: hypothetical protein EON87_11225 [Brevundimonas sp.]